MGNFGGKTKIQCANCGKDIEKYPSLIKEKNYCSNYCRCYHQRKILIGNNNPNWKGGISETKYPLLYGRTKAFKEWREKVLRRDGFTCKRCGEKKARIEVHHIKKWKDFPELRFDVNNGMSLCSWCHKILDNYKRDRKGKFSSQAMEVCNV